ncbi:hypothetical protein AWC38_SpisGene16543 [Stylophora pistillata]|uniref:Uncharacterized protein n=1 Tax=Stylophora pistillata TaxID=50429 RepID=A0A2B4RPE6_STYPI|nr:hypothetical protein AWC38_SpisGene16543 [Stylophora pistillata]
MGETSEAYIVVSLAYNLRDTSGWEQRALRDAVKFHLSLAKYNITIVTGTTCTQVEKTVEEERAVRVTYESERLLDHQGKLSLDKSVGSQITKEGIDDGLVDLKTSMKNGETKTLHGVNKTMSLEEINDQNFDFVSLARYNIVIVTGTTCKHVEKTVEGDLLMWILLLAAAEFPSACIDGK